jgi:SAGA-associated factor 11
VASEAHRAARLGFDYRLRNEEDDETHTCASARATLGDVDSSASENSGRYTVDVFEQTHPTIALEMFDCMNCGRPIVAGRFAPHLEKCMGKVSNWSVIIRPAGYLLFCRQFVEEM